MRIVDAHADLLWRLWVMPRGERTDWLEQTFGSFRMGQVMLQLLPVFVPSEVPLADKWKVTVEMTELAAAIFERSDAMAVRNREELDWLTGTWEPDGVTGLMLTLEGADSLAEDTEVRLKWLGQMGCRMLGMTWNHANVFGDGAQSDVHGGLTERGHQLIQLCERSSISLDASHLSEQSFWHLHQWSSRPYAVSHSNAAGVYAHGRNLTDAQIRAVVEKGGCIGLNMIPFLLSSERLTDVGNALDVWVAHYQKMIESGALSHIGLGSDFWGADEMIPGCGGPADWQVWMTKVQGKIHLTYSDFEKLCTRNWVYFLRKNLPVDLT